MYKKSLGKSGGRAFSWFSIGNIKRMQACRALFCTGSFLGCWSASVSGTAVLAVYAGIFKLWQL